MQCLRHTVESLLCNPARDKAIWSCSIHCFMWSKFMLGFWPKESRVPACRFYGTGSHLRLLRMQRLAGLSYVCARVFFHGRQAVKSVNTYKQATNLGISQQLFLDFDSVHSARSGIICWSILISIIDRSEAKVILIQFKNELVVRLSCFLGGW